MVEMSLGIEDTVAAILAKLQAVVDEISAKEAMAAVVAMRPVAVAPVARGVTRRVVGTMGMVKVVVAVVVEEE